MTSFQELWLPRSNITRVSKKALPPGAKIAKDAQEAATKAATVWISMITDIARSNLPGKKKTVTDIEVIKCLKEADFEEEFTDILTETMQAWRACGKLKRPPKEPPAAATAPASDDPAGEATDIDADPPSEADMAPGTPLPRKRKPTSPANDTPDKRARDEDGARRVGGMAGAEAEVSDVEEATDAEGDADGESLISDADSDGGAADGEEDADDPGFRGRDEEEHFRIPERGSEDMQTDAMDGEDEMDEDELRAAEYGTNDGEEELDVEELIEARWGR